MLSIQMAKNYMQSAHFHLLIFTFLTPLLPPKIKIFINRVALQVENSYMKFQLGSSPESWNLWFTWNVALTSKLSCDIMLAHLLFIIYYFFNAFFIHNTSANLIGQF